MSFPVEIQILFCDPWLLVVDKPAGLSTLPDGYNPTLPHIKSRLESQFGHLFIVHRLDKETSGVLLLARTAEAHRTLNTQFEHHQVVKVYHALVIGSLDWKEVTIDLRLRPNGDRHHRTVIDPRGGKPAVTHMKVLERLGSYSFIEAVPETGRTHQIRAHLSSMGLSIVGDRLYTRKDARDSLMKNTSSLSQAGLDLFQAVGMALHARSLEITHPSTHAWMRFVAPYPGWLLTMLKQLGSTIDRSMG